MSEFITIAIDGGAASGKSSTSRLLAERHNLMHVDTGAHYRTLTFALLKAQGGAAENGGISEEAVAAWLASADAVLGTQIEGRSARLTVAGVLPRDADLRTEAINGRVSQIAAIPAIRRHLYEYQRSQPKLAQERGFGGLVMEGRDIGTVILPDADLRIYLEADPVARARRAAAEGRMDAVALRDKLDSTRKTAPLAVAEGAFRLDSTHLTLEEVVQTISGLILKENGG